MKLQKQIIRLRPFICTYLLRSFAPRSNFSPVL